MVSRFVALPILALALLTASCGSSPEASEGPVLTVARIESTLMSDTPEGLASSDVGTTTDQPDEAVESSESSSVDAASGDVVRPDTSLDLEFVSFELDDVFDEGHVIEAWVPTGWEASDFFGRTFEPSNLGFFTELSLDNGCDGICEPRDWNASLNGEDGQIASERENKDVLRDEALTDGWLLVTNGEITTQVRLYRWNNDASFYFVCRANLDEDDIGLLDDMIAICSAARPQWLG